MNAKVKKIYYSFFLVLISLLVSCDQKDLFYVDETVDPVNPTKSALVDVRVDWSNVKLSPDTMTLMVYDENDRFFQQHSYDSIEYGKIRMPLCKNTVIVVNDSTNGDSCVAFRSIENLSNLEVYALPLLENNWYKKFSQDKNVAKQPQKLMVGRADSVDINQEIYDYVGLGYDTTVVTLYPVDCVKDVYVKMNVKNIYRLLAVKAAVSGLSEGYDFDLKLPLDNTVTHLIDSAAWKICPNAENPMNGHIECSFKTFGCPGSDELNKGNYDIEFFLCYPNNHDGFHLKIDSIQNKLINDGSKWIIDLTDKDYADMENVGNGSGEEDGSGEGGDPNEGSGFEPGDKNDSINVEIEDWVNK